MHCGREAGDLSSLRRAPPRAKERSFRRGREGAAPTNSITKPADADMERTEVAGRYGIQASVKNCQGADLESETAPKRQLSLPGSVVGEGDSLQN